MQSNRPSNKTQCPHCFTIYQISEDQLAQSRGNVRCGNCHERFKARLLSGQEIKHARLKVPPFNDLFTDVNKQPSDDQSTVATFEEPDKSTVVSEEDVASNNIDKEDDSGDVGFSNNPSDISINEETDIIERSSRALSLDRRSSESTERKNSSQSAINDKREPVFDFELEDSELELPTSGTKREASVNAAIDLDFVFDDNKNEISEPNSLDFTDPDSREPTISAANIVSSNDNQELINEIDRIIDNRLVNGTDSDDLEPIEPVVDDTNLGTKTSRSDGGHDENGKTDGKHNVKATGKATHVREINWDDEISHETERSDFDDDSENSSDVTWADEDDLFVEPSDKPGRKARGALSLAKFVFASIVVIGLIVLLAYQVWLKQFGFVSNNESVQTILNSLLTPSLDYLEGLDVSLDRPKNLVGIALISAQSEPHPSRPSTTLMKVSFLNKSSVDQSLPWLELSLTDESGKVVARRALQPEDYLFNNTTQAGIGPHELKKITIELLAFPKSATGFELKMLKSMSSNF